ncbi:hypothetical protein TorRG33x02_221910 [Trema orientale]|uniref:Uncharacterized protein n=1 Tax=Trema orientale TaxID=63057 RepID=A0A2P5E8V6_TREOI|nr:hypothetical protein TorRG33x02_221910 [Trema orientale]
MALQVTTKLALNVFEILDQTSAIHFLLTQGHEEEILCLFNGDKLRGRDLAKHTGCQTDEIPVAGHFPKPPPFGWAPKSDVGVRTHELILPNVDDCSVDFVDDLSAVSITIEGS